MRKFTALSTLVLFFVSATAFAQSATTKPIAPGAETAAAVLKNSPRHGEWVEIAVPNSETKIRSWVVYPERSEKAPVVIVLHEIFGLSDWIRAVTDQLAAEGFIAVAPDLLSGKGPNGGGTESFKADEVRAAIGKLDKGEVAKHLDAVRDYAIALPAATDKVATVGFCWGGTASFNYAVHQPKLAGAVVYYGTAPKAEELAKITAPVLGLYGGDDARVTSTVEPTIASMKSAGKRYSPHVYEKAGHGFLRQQSGREGANQRAAEEAWAETIRFLKGL